MNTTNDTAEARHAQFLPVVGWIRHRIDCITTQDALDLALRLSLVMVLLFPGDLWFHRIYIRILAIWGFIDRPLLRNRWYWLILFALNFSVQNLYNWAASDNHTWLISYWYLAIGLSIGGANPRINIAESARLLVGLTFLFATLRKVLAQEYLSGIAFKFLLATDGRFFEVAKLLGGHSQNVNAIRLPMSELAATVPLPAGEQLEQLAIYLTWWTLAIEFTIALVFLAPLKDHNRAIHIRNVSLLLFVATTYPIAPVLGFAWILLIMGYSQCPDSLRRTRFCYLLALAGVFAFHGEGLKMVVIETIYGKEFFG